jgi:hypothetical protein
MLTEARIGDIKRNVVQQKFSEKAMIEAFDSFMKQISNAQF